MGEIMKLAGKKLLFLGGALFQLPALKRAKELGCHLILVDGNPAVPGRIFADEFLAVSTIDKDEILKVAIDRSIDGVMTYASDSSVGSVAHVAQQLGLPGNPPESAMTIRRKDLFRDFQSRAGLPHPTYFAALTMEDVVKNVAALTFPLVVKPVDSAGTKGQSVIYSKNELERALTYALNHSREKIAVFESFIPSEIMELDGDVWFHNHRLAFRHYGHNHFQKNRISNVPLGEIFPAFMDDGLALKLDGQLNKVIEGLNLSSGCMNFDALVCNDEVYIIDIGLRNGGNYVPDLIKLSTGFDLTEAAIYSALGEEYPSETLFCKDPAPVASFFIGSRFGGVFEGVSFDDSISNFVVETRMFLESGDVIQPFTRSDLAAGIAFLKFPDQDTLKRVMGDIEDLTNLRVKPLTTPERLAYRDSSEKQAKRGTELHDGFKEFPELISPFLRKQLALAEESNNQDVIRVITRQYMRTGHEEEMNAGEGLKHYDADHSIMWEGHALHGVERLYRRVIVFEPLYNCASNCRYCLRRNYEPFNQTLADIERIARYIGNAPGHEELREVLITGGDPFLAINKVEHFLSHLSRYAPQIKIVRIATRVPVHEPQLINDTVLSMFGKNYPFRFEIATQINHVSELFPETKDAYRKLLQVVPVIYNQTVLLKGVNDTYDELIDLFDALREIGIENHYLFHCVPIGGLKSFRVPLLKCIELARKVTSSGRISGRSKPMFCIMTSIGKITPYEVTILEQKDNRVLLRSNYSYKERLAWNPTWKLPANAIVDNDGNLCVWYEDASDE